MNNTQINSKNEAIIASIKEKLSSIEEDLSNLLPCAEEEVIKVNDYTTGYISIPMDVIGRGVLNYFGEQTQISPDPKDWESQFSGGLPVGSKVFTEVYGDHLNIVWFIPEIWDQDLKIRFSFRDLDGRAKVKFGNSKYNGLTIPNFMSAEKVYEIFIDVLNLVEGFNTLYMDFDGEAPATLLPHVYDLLPGDRIYLRSLGERIDKEGLINKLDTIGWDYINIT